jgi:hypothetical protein
MLTPASLSFALILAACGDDPTTDTDTGSDATADVADAESDTSPDTVEPDATDVEIGDSDTDPDTEPDVDAAPDADTDTEPPYLPCGGDGATAATSPVIAGALADTYTLVYDEIVAGGPWADGAEVTAVLGDDDTITVDGVSMTGPLMRGGIRTSVAEAVWCSGQWEYAVSDIDNDTFNEINLFDRTRADGDGLATFVGQLTEVFDGVDMSLVTPYAGTWNVTRVWDGSHERETLTIDEDGNVDFDTGVNVPVSTATAVYDRIGCCTRVQVDYTPSASNGWTTSINFHLEADGESFLLKDVVRSHQGEDGTGSGVDDVSVLTLPEVPEPTAATPDGGDNRISGTVDGTLYSIVDAGPDSPVFGTFSIRAQNPTGGEEPGLTIWQITAPAEIGEYPCFQLDGTPPFIGWRTPGAPPYGTTGDTGDCVVHVDAITLDGMTLTSVAGRFSAVLRDSHRNLVATVEDGAFFYEASE